MTINNGSSRYEGFLVETDLRGAGEGARAMVTRDHESIRRWAKRRQAEPATGEATASGPATLSVNDRGAGIRFNFPGLHRFRPITWDEWFDNFDRHDLLFVYEEDVAERAHELWLARGAVDGNDHADWFEAESQLRGRSGAALGRYRIVKRRPEAQPPTHPDGATE